MKPGSRHSKPTPAHRETAQQTKTETHMDVHHPHHLHSKKKWVEYLGEFLMLFLAVFLGFVAENIRENVVERHREKEYMGLLVEDLREDTAVLNRAIPPMSETVRGLDSLIDDTYRYLAGTGDTRRMYYGYHHFVRNTTNLQLSERAVNQLKSSGNMRLIRDAKAARIVSDLEVGFEGLKESTRFYKTRQEDPAVFGFRIFDFQVYQAANRLPDGTFDDAERGFLSLPKAPVLNTTDPIYLREFAARVGYYRNSLASYLSGLERAVPELSRSIVYLEGRYGGK
ncbi:MAG: hypothetical protein JWP27_2904 [Flaviaesturariibacter sp.]|nr:hypothetical protein [Flaviaesturariibacter sp.]